MIFTKLNAIVLSKLSALKAGVPLFLSGILVVLLIFFGPNIAQAVTVSITATSSVVERGEDLTFTSTVTIQPNERIPIAGAKLRIFSEAAASTELTASPYLSPRTMSLISITPSGTGFGYGYGGY